MQINTIYPHIFYQQLLDSFVLILFPMFRKIVCSSSKFCVRAISAAPVQKSFPQHAFLTVRHSSLVPVGSDPLYERVKMIDTTLTSEQQAYVETLKRKLKGGPKSPKC
jgi:hypothetical protein